MFRNGVNKLRMGLLLGGWEEGFKERQDEEPNEFYGIKLQKKEKQRPGANLYVTD